MKGNSKSTKSERRRFPRVMAPVFCKTPRILSARRRVSDLSLGGVRIYSDEWHNVGELLELEFFFPDGSTVEAIGKVVWLKEMPEGAEALFDVGLEFVELSDAAIKKLKAVLKNK